jgi:tetratricopeptide (TPR) repeat protein
MFLAMIMMFFTLNASASVQEPCQAKEHWNFGSTKDSRWMKAFREFTAHRAEPLESLSEAVQLKRLSKLMSSGTFESDFSEYWLGRVLYDLELYPLAARAFGSVYENTSNSDLKKASLACMTRIEMKLPDWKAPDIRSIDKTLWAEEDSEVILANLLSHGVEGYAQLKFNGQSLLNGIKHLRQKQFTDAIVDLKTFLTQAEAPGNAWMIGYQDQARLLLGRAYYSTARFSEAATEFQKVSKTSNLEIEALSNLAWAYLLEGKYDDAIGVSLQLRTGNLRKTFAPEPVMIAAMALNEICIYPESIRMIRAFIKDYGPVREWLLKNENSLDGYRLAAQALKQQGTAPVKLSTEWLRAPEFQNRQKEINTIIGQEKIMSSTARKGVEIQKRISQEFLNHATSFIREAKLARLSSRKNDADLQSKYSDLRKEWRKVARFHKASTTWKTLTRQWQKTAESTRGALVKKVNEDLKQKNRKMLTLIENIRKNSDLIEVEIYNGASQDLIWKSNHPEFGRISRTLEESKPEADSARTWSWGRFATADIEDNEVWEDELGALKADVQNHCGMKEKYLKLGLNQSKEQGK